MGIGAGPADHGKNLFELNIGDSGHTLYPDKASLPTVSVGKRCLTCTGRNVHLSRLAFHIQFDRP